MIFRRLLVYLFAVGVCGCKTLNPVRVYLESKLPSVESPASFNSSVEMVPVRSGEKLYTLIYRPVAPQTPPCVLVRIPLPERLRYALFSDAFGAIWARRGYTAVIQHVRGFPPSTGDFEPFVHEREDGEDTLRWLRDNGVCAGELYSWGGSYFGITQWVVGDLYPGAKMIQIASPRLDRVFFPGGAFALSTALFWTARNYDVQLRPGEIARAARLGAAETADERVLGRATGYYRQWFESQGDNGFWEGQVPVLGDRVRGPVFLMGGWYDPFLPAMLEDAKALRQREGLEQVKLVIGPWGHAKSVKLPDGFIPQDYRIESIVRPLAWIECLRRGCKEAQVEIFLMGANRWLALEEFPPSTDPSIWPIDLVRMEMTDPETSIAKGGIGLTGEPASLTLTLDPQDPTPSAGGVELGYDIGPASQVEIERRSDVATIRSTSLANPLTIIGTPVLSATITPATCSRDLAVTLEDVFPDGTPYLITEGVRRFQPGETSGEIPFWPTAYRVAAGHRLGLQIAPAKFPKYDLPPCIGAEKKSQLTLRLRSDPRNEWKILIPVSREVDVERDGEVP